MNKPIIGYKGGKVRIAPQIMEYMTDHKVYVEPFFGSGGVFFCKGYKQVTNDHDYREVIGDLDSNVTNFYKQLRENHEAMMEKLQYFEYSEDLSQEAKTNSDTYKQADNITKACYFFFNILSSFGSSLNAGFAYSKTSQNNVQTFNNKTKLIPQYVSRLKQCYIFNKDYKTLIDRFDSPDTLFYFDPPYQNTGKYDIQREHEFNYPEFAQNIKGIQGKFILSHYFDSFIKDNFSDYHIKHLKHKVSICKAQDGKRKAQEVDEVIVMNYDPFKIRIFNQSNKNPLFNF